MVGGCFGTYPRVISEIQGDFICDILCIFMRFWFAENTKRQKLSVKASIGYRFGSNFKLSNSI